MLRLEGVELRAGDSEGASLLCGAELAVEEGDVRVVYGEPGSGKSSLIRVLAGLTEVSSGTASVLDCDLAKLQSGSLQRLRQKVALIDENPQFLEDRPAFENIAVALEILALSRSDIQSLGIEALARVGLAERSDVVVAKLSRSERLWLAVARAIARKPIVVLADEPWRELDEVGRDRFCNLLAELAADGAACLVTTGDHSTVELAELWSWSVSELREGLIVPFHELAVGEVVERAEEIDLTEELAAVAAGSGLAEVLPFPIRAEASGAN